MLSNICLYLTNETISKDLQKLSLTDELGGNRREFRISRHNFAQCGKGLEVMMMT